MRLTAVLATVAVFLAASVQAQTSLPSSPRVDPSTIKVFGRLPAPGSALDVLACAAANELLWKEVARSDPSSREASEAKRKAGWYAAVALQVFALDSRAIVEAIEVASLPSARSVTLEKARKCRPAPENWRE